MMKYWSQNTFLFLSVLLVLIQSGCAVGPDYRRPELELPRKFREAGLATSTADSLGELHWRAVYTDRTVQGLVEEALASAPDIRQAEARVREAEAVAGVSRGNLLPNLSISFATSPVPRAAGDTLTSNYTGGATVSWALDLWGELRRADEAARAELLAREETRRGVAASLVADVAGRYYQLLAEHQTLKVAEQTASNQRAALALIVRLAASGISSAAEVRQQEVALAATEATLPVLRRQIAASENALAVLLGRVPGPLAVDPASSLAMSEVVPAGLPSRLLERRPDILASEQQLIAANARVGEAKARFFPNVSLTGLFGNIGVEATDVLTGGAATVASLGANAVQPLFAGGRLYFGQEAALARLDQALVGYRRTVLGALAEVADALTAYREAGLLLDVQTKRVVSAREALRLAELRYRSGTTSYIEVLDAQRQLFAAETEEVSSLLERRLAYSRIYLALGGGWEMAQTDSRSPAGPVMTE